MRKDKINFDPLIIILGHHYVIILLAKMLIWTLFLPVLTPGNSNYAILLRNIPSVNWASTSRPFSFYQPTAIPK